MTSMRILPILISGIFLVGLITPAQSAEKRKAPDMEALSKIQLRDNATKREVRDYVQRIFQASRDQRSYFASDPQVGMLKEVGPGNVDVLIEVARDGLGWTNYAVYALEDLVNDTHRHRILSVLPRQRRLVRVVVAKGWEDDAREILINGLRNYTGYLPSQWISAVASFHSPSTYDVLIDYFVNGWNRHVTYGIIKGLPGIDLTKALPKAWESARTSGRKYEIGSLTQSAIAVGYRPALDYVIDTLDDNDGVPRTLYRARAVALRYLDVHGSNEEIRDWYRENRDQLQFDPADKKFKRKNKFGFF